MLVVFVGSNFVEYHNDKGALISLWAKTMVEPFIILDLLLDAATATSFCSYQ
jgi:hypothetical protein